MSGIKPTAQLQRFLCLSGASLLAISPLSSALAITPTVQQSISGTEVAGFGDLIRDADRILDIREQERQREDQRRARRLQEEEAARRLAAYEEAQRAAAEATRLEAQQRREYWESLSPADQRAYYEEQQRLQQQQDEAATLMVLGLLSAAAAFGGDSCEVYHDNGTYAGNVC